MNTTRVPLRPLLALLLVAAAVSTQGCPKEDARSHAMRIESESQLIGGPAALGEVGDWLLYNDQIRLIVRDVGTSPGFGMYGGCLLDADLIRGTEEFDGQGNDRWGELFPLINFVFAHPEEDPEIGAISIVSDGADGGPAIVRVEGYRDRYIHILKLLPDLLNGNEKYFRVRTDYILNPGVRYLEMVTEIYIPEEVAQEQGFTLESIFVDLPDNAEAVDPLAQLVNGVLPPILAEDEDLENVGGDPLVVTSPAVDFEAAGAAAGHLIKATLDGGDLGEAEIVSVSGHELTLDGDLDVGTSGVYFRVLGDSGDSGEVFGDFLFPGGKLDFFMPDDENPSRADWNGGMGPGVGYDHEGAVLAVTRTGESTFSNPLLVDFFAASADGVSYAYGTRDGKVSIPMLSESFSVGFTHDTDLQMLMVPGQAIRFRRYFTVGDGDVASAAAVLWRDVRGEPLGELRGFVLDGSTGQGISGASVLAFRDPDPTAADIPGRDQLAGPVTQFGTDLYRDRAADGSFGGALRPGDYLLVAVGHGHVKGEPVRVHVDEGESVEIALVLPEIATVHYDVIDARGEHIPCKLTFHGHDGVGKPDPMLGEGYLPGDLSFLEFSGMGVGEVEVAPGTYTVEISRGTEYNLDVHTFTVPPSGAVSLHGVIERVVDTTGWVSADLHTHMQNSPDSGEPFDARVVSFLAEHVEYAVTSDHDHLTNLQPLIEEMGANEYVKATVGDELTTIELGHFNGWPLVFDPSLPEDGAPDWAQPSEVLSTFSGEPLSYSTPIEIYNMLHDAGRYGPEETVVQNNHPRDGILGNFYEYAIDLQSGEPVQDGNTLAMLHDIIIADHWSYDFDAIEMSNGKRQDLVRTPTIHEVRAFNDSDSGTIYSALARTSEEQDALRNGETGLDASYAGALDDWMNWLNLGRRYTATGNSDSHASKEEAGMPRNYIRSGTDLPDFIDELEMSRAILDSRLSHTWGPFLEFWVTGDEGTGEIGDTVIDGDGEVELRIRVQSPTWFDVDRIEIYQNGVMICEIEGDSTCGVEADNYGLFHPNQDVVNFDGTIPIALEDYWLYSTPDDHPLPPAEYGTPVDSWFAVVAMGDSNMAPLAAELTREPIRLADVLSGALGALRFEDMESSLLSGIDINLGANFHVVFPIVPWGLTNAIWVDADGDGEWQEPGLPLYVTYYDWEAMKGE